MQTDKEQAEISVSKIGKFNTADDLLSAYNALQSEFTKRCQLVKQLQAELDSLRAQDDVADGKLSLENERDGSAASDDVSSSVETSAECEPAAAATESATAPTEADDAESATAENVLNEIAAHAADYAELLSAIPEIMDACVARYKHKLMEPRGGVAPAGMAVIMPAKRPRSLYEAKLLADELLSK